MSRHAILATALTSVVFCGSSSGQEAAKVDFGRDVQPLLKQHCVGCHGPAIHQGGFRLDRRADAMRGLLAEQRPDGGWSQLRSLPSDAYATGQALVALKESGALALSDPAYQKGVQFLLNSQFEDGSWLVKSRAIALQPLFDIGFPHGPDSWISAAGTNWATMALATAVRAR